MVFKISQGPVAVLTKAQMKNFTFSLTGFTFPTDDYLQLKNNLGWMIVFSPDHFERSYFSFSYIKYSHSLHMAPVVEFMCQEER